MRRDGFSLHAVACAAVLAAVSLAPPAPALAQDERATVRVDGRAVFRVGAASDLSASERARRVESRIHSLLQNPRAVAPARIEPSAANGTDRVVTVSGVPVVTVTESDAQDNLTTADALAAQWSQAIDAEPPASVRVRELGQDDIVVEARFRTDSRRSDFLATTSNVRETIINALRGAGVGLPDPGVRVLVPRRAGEWRRALGVE